ncbi:MAG: AAA family ATPase [Oceanicaulis sp.]|nr:AAA family ATPase [Oceanicaulis sp.]
MSQRILLFNHKGGVGKTTSAYNIGWKFAQKGYRVLLVDGDSQVNLSARSLGERFESYYDEGADTEKYNLYDAVLPVFEGRPQPIHDFECPLAQNSDKLYLLPGHPNLSSLEGQISLAQETRGTLSVTKNIPGALHRIISLAELRHEIDISIVDINPGLGALNQNFFMICQSFIVPTNPDPFSLMSLKTLALEISKWVDWKQSYGSSFFDATYPLPEGWAKFLGALHSRFNRHKSKAAGQYHKRISEIDDRIEDSFVPAMKKSGCMYPDDRYLEASHIILPSSAADADKVRPYALARVPDFGQITHLASDFDKPVFAITDDDIKDLLYGHVKTSVEANIQTLDLLFDAVCEKIRVVISDD